MTLKPGTRLGPYEIRALLGAGGMGEVYQGWDTRLDRFVAIKILPAHLAERPELRERFEREAKATANLKHPNICVLYDVGRQELEGEDQSRERERPVISGSPEHSWPEEAKEAKERHTQRPAGLSRAESRDRRTVHFLVMEYLEGETLSARLKRGPLPLELVLQYAAEISDALDKAHRQGYTHRDIKPGNIMLVPVGGSGSHGTLGVPWAFSGPNPERAHGIKNMPWLPTPGRPSGTNSKTETKLLDFGLAKFKQEIVKATLPASEMPTVPGTLTEHGTLLGTLHYMAPEQVESKDVDSRADLFAFGAVVYEMATGKKAFDGETQASVIAKILEVEPPAMSSLDPPGQLSPPALDRLVKKCLRKDREDRWQSARDVTDELKWIKEGGGKQSTAEVAEAKPRAEIWRRAMPWAAAVIASALIAGLAVWILRPSSSPASGPVSRFVMTLPAGQPLHGAFGGSSIALSPDGTALAYSVTAGNRIQLFLRSLDNPEAKPIPGTDGARYPFFSPDGQWLVFSVLGPSGEVLKKVSMNGGEPLTLCECGQNLRGISWGPNDTIVFAPSLTSGIWQVSASGGTPQVLTTLDAAKGEQSHRWPELLPGGKALLFTSGSEGAWADAEIVVQRLDTGERRVLVSGGTYGHYLPTGHLVYLRQGTLMAVPFDLGRLELSGTAAPVVERIHQQPSSGGPTVSFSSLGSLAYLPASFGESTEVSKLVWVDRKGVVQPLEAPPRYYLFPTLSPDGRRVAVMISGANANVWVYDIPSESQTRLTFEGNDNGLPVWAASGSRIAFLSIQGGPWNLFWKAADGSGAQERLTTSTHPQSPSSVSPDGKLLAFTDFDPETGGDIWVLPLEEERKPQPFLKTPFFEGGAMFSPDGRWLAHTSNESGRYEVYVQPFPGPGGKRQVSSGGGQQPVWARNGRELFYLDNNQQKLMAVDTNIQPTFTASRPRELFEIQRIAAIAPPEHSVYDISPDGQRFLTVQYIEPPQEATPINVVLNWFEELKRRVP